MKRFIINILSVIALCALGLSFYHASWTADPPQGKIKLIADRGLTPLVDDRGCLASVNMGLEAVSFGADVGSLQTAAGSEADAVRVPVESVSGQLLIARQHESKCAADKNRPRSTVAEAAAGLTKPEIIWQAKGAADAKALLGALPANEPRYMFMGDEEAVKVIRAARPNARAFSIASAQGCVSDYKLSGLWGQVPASCKNGVMLLTLDDLGITLWGYPNRFFARMAESNTRLIVADSVVDGKIKGLSEPSQYGDIAESYKGYIWIDKIEELGPALKR